jgi:hypothetical protein
LAAAQARGARLVAQRFHAMIGCCAEDQGLQVGELLDHGRDGKPEADAAVYRGLVARHALGQSRAR